jgi:dihydrofolate reductase
MRKLVAFTQLTLNGFFAGPAGDISWAHKDSHDTEWNEFVAGNAAGGGMLLFGRITYEMMASFWPTPMAQQMNPVVAAGMNRMPKVVFSRTLDEASWANTTLVKDGLAAKVSQLKSEPGPGMAILGSGSIVAQLAEVGLIDEYQLVINPLALGEGKPLFYGIQAKLSLKLVKTRTFGNGSVLLCYEPF